MQSFLEKTVLYLTEKYQDNISELCIVLPNRRAGLFLKTHFSNTLKKTFWSPEVYATEDFIALLAELEIADSTTLLFELYEIVKSIDKNKTESFDEFSKWGQILLSDFNEIDRYLVDATKLFGNLKNIKELEAWSLNSEEGLTDFQKKYLHFWQQLGNYYTSFTNHLLSKNLVYQGLAYRIVADKVQERVNKHPWKKIIFVGFNALNKAEEVVIEKLISLGKAEIIWDTDSYYTNNINQEAGYFFRKYNAFGNFKKKEDSSIVFEETLLCAGKKNITVIGAAKNVVQAKVAGNLIAEIKKIDESLQTSALVLADENLLFPVLHSLPENLQDINVTMGYPLKNTPVAGYFDLVFSLHENGQKFTKGNANYSFYHNDILKLLSHPYTSIALSGKGKNYSVKPIIQAIQKRNIVFASFSILENIFNEFNCINEFELLLPVFTRWKTPSDTLLCIHYLIGILKDSIINQQDKKVENKTSLELEYFFAYTKIIKRIEVLMQAYPGSIIDLKTLRSIVNQIVRSSTLPFYGEPLRGLQVMGMLETRTLDFENVILLSCNEDILPSAKSVNSFIPFELKKYFGLPTYSDKDAIFAYHFYRLLQRASNIYLVYNTENDAFVSGEKSRFLTQLIYELPKVNPNIIITEKLVSIPESTKKNNNAINVVKTKAILEQLKAKSEYGFSPSLLNKYRNCSLQFYFHSIAGLKEIDEVEETIGAATLGDAIHEVLEILYQPFVGKKITIANINEMKKDVEIKTISAFEKYYSKNEISFGKNLLTLKVALKFISNFLDSEKELITKSNKNSQPISIKSLEQELETSLIIGSETIKIKGKVDRIDSIGSITRIIDYKTGLADYKELKFDNWDNIRTDTKLAKSFQLLIYAFIYQKTNPTITENILSGIVSFRELSAGLKTVKVSGNDFLNISILLEFENQLKRLLSDILNPELAFSQTTEIDNCEFCSFKGICNR